jgi:RNA-directed DNA polymerase
LKQTKPYKISKLKLWEAYQLVRRNGGAAGIDGMTLEKLAEREKDLLYKLWNRMSSGSYFPKAVRRVEIPKKSGGTRALGIPTVLDRIAQMTARIYLEPILEPQFHPDSYGYRPRKSAHQALEVTRKRCWEYDWVIDLDIKGFFDTIDHELMMKAVDFHDPPDWIRLYVERWLKAPVQDTEGKIHERMEGTPQGGVISPLLANLFLHYAFDQWMTRNHARNPYERYADDVIVHCRTEKEARELLEKIRQRFKECKLTVHPEKTKIVYCKDSNRKGEGELTEFDFLGYTFRPRLVKGKQGYFVGFTPAISKKAEKSIRDTIRSWNLHRKSETDFNDLSKKWNPKLRGWLEYYGKFRPTALLGVCQMFQKILVKWAKRRFKRLKRNWQRAFRFVNRIAKTQPKMFAHWERGWCLKG